MRRTLVVAGLGLLAIGCRPPPGPVVVSPKAIDKPMPKPKKVGKTKAAAAGKAGSVTVAYCVDTDGKTQDVVVKVPVDPEYDRLAVKAVKRWTFEPATRDGVPYEHCTDATIEFRP